MRAAAKNKTKSDVKPETHNPVDPTEANQRGKQVLNESDDTFTSESIATTNKFLIEQTSKENIFHLEPVEHSRSQDLDLSKQGSSDSVKIDKKDKKRDKNKNDTPRGETKSKEGETNATASKSKELEIKNKEGETKSKEGETKSKEGETKSKEGETKNKEGETNAIASKSKELEIKKQRRRIQEQRKRSEIKI